MADNGIYYYADVEESHYEVLTGPDGKFIYFTKVTVRLHFVNVDNPEDRVSYRGVGIGLDPSDKSVGKAVSYATKYALLKGLMMETGDDPEKDDFVPSPSPVPSAAPGGIANTPTRFTPPRSVKSAVAETKTAAVEIDMQNMQKATPVKKVTGAQVGYLYMFGKENGLTQVEVAKEAVRFCGGTLYDLPAADVDAFKGRLISLGSGKGIEEKAEAKG